MPGLESPESNGPAKDVPPAPAEGGLPEKRIISQAHLEAFLSSPTHQDILAFIEALNDRCAGVKTTDSCERSPVISAILSILSSIAGYVELCPPVDNALSRFGNPSFRSFYDKVVLESPQLHASIPGLPAERIPELSVYLTESFGNRDRIDYGSGMELNFICWLLCLQKLGLLQPSDYKALVITVFCTYLQDMRALQSTYWLEPAGSHGVWGLDDYAFLPFLFGASQLKGHRHLRPKSIHDKDIIEEFSKDYMYLSCIKFINSIKTASLVWHSPMLNDISAVKTWDKINSGLLKMYKAEVLAKLPVAQHIYFGSLLPYPLPKDVDLGDAAPHDEHGHIHVRGEMWGDCCGIKVPSAFGAAQQAAGDVRIPLSNTVKRVPFD